MCLPSGVLLPGTRPPLYCRQKGIYGLLFGTDEHLFYVLLACALTMPYHRLPPGTWGRVLGRPLDSENQYLLFAPVCDSLSGAQWTP